MSRSGILKTGDNSSKSSNRVQFRIPVSVKTTLSDYVKGQDSRLYLETVGLIRDSQLTDEDLIALLKEVKSIIFLLDKRLKLFVQVVLLIPWTHRVGPVVEAYQSFLVDLLATHNYYVEIAFSILVRNFRRADPCADDDDPLPSFYERNISGNIHKVLHTILRVIPLSQEMLVEEFKKQYPYIRVSAREQELYVGNLLTVTKYRPNLRSSVLFMLFAKMLLLDVNSSYEEVLNMEEEDEIDTVDETMETSSTITSMTGGPLIKRVGGSGMRHPVANTLDRQVLRLLSYFDSECTKKNNEIKENGEIKDSDEIMENNWSISEVKEPLNPDEECDASSKTEELHEEKEIDWIAAKSLYEDVKDAFYQFILPTEGCFHIQFLMFYLVAGGLRDGKSVEKGQQWLKLSDAFVSFLWSRGSCLTVAPVERNAALGYLSSFLARSKNLPIRMTKAVLMEMSSWVHAYMRRQEYVDGGSLSRECANQNHDAFHSICHALFYIIAFRQLDLAKTADDIAFLRSLNLSSIVTSSLNPLKTCLPAIAKRFASAVESLQLAYCSTVMEANAREAIPVLDDKLVMPFKIRAIFPFDRYILTRSSPLILPLILEYQGPKEEDDTAGASGDEEIDDIIEESGYSCIRRTRDPSISDLYGTSPGLMDLSTSF